MCPNSHVLLRTYCDMHKLICSISLLQSNSHLSHLSSLSNCLGSCSVYKFFILLNYGAGLASYPMINKKSCLSNFLSSACSFFRTELLTMVKKHSHLIGWTIVDAEDDASDVGMDDKFWHEMLDLFFVRGRQSKRSEEDDLVFFVNNMVRTHYGSC